MRRNPSKPLPTGANRKRQADPARRKPPNSPRDALMRASRLRKSGDLARAAQALAPFAESEYTGILNERLYIAIAQARARRPRPSNIDTLDAGMGIVRTSQARPNSRTYNALLSALRIQRGEEGDSGPGISPAGDPMAALLLSRALNLVERMRPVEPDSYTLSAVFQLCGAAGDSAAAQRFLEMNGGEASLDAISGSALVGALAACGDADRAEDVFKSIVARGVGADERSFAIVISAFQRAGMHGAVMRCLDAALSNPEVRLNWFVFSGALASCARVGDATHARRIYSELLRAGIRPSRGALSCVLDAAIRGNDVQLGLDVLYDFMQQRRIVPARDQVNKLIALCGRVGANGGGGEDAVLRILETMTSKLEVVPDIGTYNAAIAALGRTKNMKTARYLLDIRIPQLGLKPNVVTYNSLMHACGLVGNVYVSFELLQDMHNSALIPNQVSYNILLDQCARAGESELCARVLSDMKLAQGVGLESKSVSSLLQLFRSSRDVDAAISIVAWVENDSGRESLDTPVYNMLISICFDNNRQAHAIGLIGMLFVERRVDTGTYNAAISYAGIRRKNVAWAFRIFDFMKVSRRAVPDAMTYSTLIRCCSLNGQIEKAFRLLAEMQDVGLGVGDTFAWTAVIDGCGRSGQWERALEILNYMQQQGDTSPKRGESLSLRFRGLVPRPSIETYNAALYAAGVGGGGWKGAKLVYDLLGADPGVSADHVTYSSLASAILENQDNTQDVATVERVVVGLQKSAQQLRKEKKLLREKSKGIAKTLKRIDAKVSRLQWYLGILRQTPEISLPKKQEVPESTTVPNVDEPPEGFAKTRVTGE